MRILIQRVSKADVSVAHKTVASIDHGMLVFVGIGVNDTNEIGIKMVDRMLKYRLFEDEQGKLSKNLSQVDGGLLLVSQFTLMANTAKGLRPDFAPAMPSPAAKLIYQNLVKHAQSQYHKVETGIFAADMKVQLINDGPISLILEL